MSTNRFPPGGADIEPEQSSDPTAKIVERIFQEFADGRSPVEISARLNADGFPK